MHLYTYVIISQGNKMISFSISGEHRPCNTLCWVMVKFVHPCAKVMALLLRKFGLC